jgi:hypothetical protein
MTFMITRFLKKITGIERREAELRELYTLIAQQTQAEARRVLADAETTRLAAEAAAAAADRALVDAAMAAAMRTPKQAATENGEPWVNINSVKVDDENPGQGAFELDWNEFFVAKLVRSGYAGKADEQIVDQWFQDVCRHVVLETYEQYEANFPQGPAIKKRDLGDGRTEVS